MLDFLESSEWWSRSVLFYLFMAWHGRGCCSRLEYVTAGGKGGGWAEKNGGEGLWQMGGEGCLCSRGVEVAWRIGVGRRATAEGSLEIV